MVKKCIWNGARNLDYFRLSVTMIKGNAMGLLLTLTALVFITCKTTEESHDIAAEWLDQFNDNTPLTSAKAVFFAKLADIAYFEDMDKHVALSRELIGQGIDIAFYFSQDQSFFASVWHIGPKLLISIRGTELDHSGQERNEQVRRLINNVIADINISQVSLTDDIPGEVHSGFKNSANDLLSGPLSSRTSRSIFKRTLAETIESFCQNDSNGIHVSGHSLGAAIASFIGILHRGCTKTVYGFGSPKVANKAFLQWFDIQGVHIFNFAYSTDLVPHVPFDKTKLPPFFTGIFEEKEFTEKRILHGIGRQIFIKDEKDAGEPRLSCLYARPENHFEPPQKQARLQRSLDFIESHNRERIANWRTPDFSLFSVFFERHDISDYVTALSSMKERFKFCQN